jgi:hypothetical protein
VLPHVLNMLGPWIDERHVLARLHHMGAGIPADGTRSDNCYLPPHAVLPALLAAQRLPRRPRSSQQLNSVAARCPLKKILMRRPRSVAV